MNTDATTSLIHGPAWFQRFARGNSRSQWQPIPRFGWAVGFYLVLTVIALPLGGALFYSSKQKIDFAFRYDDFGDEDNASRLSQIRDDNNPFQTKVVITANETMNSPVYVYYELRHFYQNHKRYVRSLDQDQLGGGTSSPRTECNPYQYVTVDPQQNDTASDERMPIRPCGLIAHSLFNDTFKLDSVVDGKNVSVAEVTMEENGIATEWDRKYLYGNVIPLNFNDVAETRGGGTIDGNLTDDEHFMVWMRVGSRSTVRKLYGIIRQDIPKGSRLTFTITHRYNTYDFDGQKRLILTTSNWTGGRNDVIGIVYFVIGSLSAVACIGILAMDLRSNRKPGDLSALSWNKEERRVS